MKLAIMQPYFFPYIGYFQAISAVDKYILYDNLNFIKKEWVNRNRYLEKNRNSCYFHVPLKDKSSFKKIHEIELIGDDKWKKKILNFLFFNYKKAKYFDDVYPLIEYVINYPTNKLTEINFQSIKSVCDYLNIKTEITTDNVKYNDIEIKLTAENIDGKDFPDLKLIDWQRKVVRVLEICRIERANIYINAIGGINLYSKEVFLQNGIDLKFIKTKNIEYKQFDTDFVPDLSIIDVMMFNSPEEIRKLLNQFELV
jgi:hypothetical protein